MSNTETNPIRDPVSTIFALRPKHSVVLASLLEGGYAAFDFVPANAEDPKAAVQLLLGADGDGWKQKLRRVGEIFCFVLGIWKMRSDEYMDGDPNSHSS